MQNLTKQMALPTALEDRLPETIADRTKRVYDRLAAVYPLSTMFFHSRAHRCALQQAGIRDGMRVLEIATGSGEMFRRLVKVNPSGVTFGLDLSPNMAARTQEHVTRRFPNSFARCQAVDARHLPFREETFDAVVCCYLLELLSHDDILRTLKEVHRVLRRNGKATMVLIGQDTAFFNSIYRVVGGMVPAFWGRQIEQRASEYFDQARLRIVSDHVVRQTFYPSRVLTAQKLK
jgi:ubiquinone/menaquinone biosynthesis C-methylase UbiE